MPFAEVLGHRRLIELLSRAVARDALPPSLLFSGPAGVGKRLTAIAVAQALNCTKPNRESPEPGTENRKSGTRLDACGTCSACTRIERGLHPDVIVIEPGENGSIKIDDVRDVIDRAAYRPFEGRRRVV